MAEDRTIGVDEPALDDAALEALATAYAKEPPSRLRDRVLAAARRDAALERRARTLASRWRVVGAAAAGLALVLGGLLVREAYHAGELASDYLGLQESNKTLMARVDEQERTLAGLREAVAAQAQVLKVLGGPHTLSASLQPKEGGTGSGRVLVDPASGEAAIVVAGLHPAGEGRVYELWAIRGDRPPEPAGLFSVGAEGTAVARATPVANPAGVTAFAVSLEPAGGSKSPSGPVVLVGAVAG